jgi:hypothetical protein
MIVNDGGAQISDNGGSTWSSLNNQPTAQFYRHYRQSFSLSNICSATRQ